MRTPKFPKTVAASKRLSGNLWDLADALAEEVPPGSPLSLFDEAAEELVKFDGEPYAPNTLRLYRDTAVSWPRDARASRVSFRGHQVLNADPQRFEKIENVKTSRQAAAAAGHKPWDQSTKKPTSTQEKVDAVREFLSDEEVATAAASDAHVRAAFSRASEHADEERHERARTTDPLGGTRDKLEVEKSIATLNKMARHLVEQVGSVDEPQDGWPDRIDAVIELLEMAKDVASGGGFDKAMADLLSGGDAA